MTGVAKYIHNFTLTELKAIMKCLGFYKADIRQATTKVKAGKAIVSKNPSVKQWAKCITNLYLKPEVKRKQPEAKRKQPEAKHKQPEAKRKQPEAKQRRRDDAPPIQYSGDRAIVYNMLVDMKVTTLRGILKRLGFTHGKVLLADARAMLLGNMHPRIRNKPTNVRITLNSSQVHELLADVEEEKKAKAESLDLKKKRKMTAAHRVAEHLKKKLRLMKKI